MDRIISAFRRPGLRQALLAVFLIVLAVGLGVRASDEYRWSDWGFGDAQSMLSLRQWYEEGWHANYFLFIPQGYAKVVKLLDEPALRHHAHGTCPGSAPGVGPRLWYTHYPAGYLVPYAVLFELGLNDIFSARMLSLLFSLTALLLMYLVFSRIAGPAVSLIAVIVYGLTPAFLGYADSIANQPVDDLLRFGFMLAVVFSTRAESEISRNKWMAAAWLLEFLLSLCSFDSVFFIYVWLVGWDLIERKGFRWKRYLLFGLAPVIAHSLQLAQNFWYLGWDIAIKDVKVTFFQKTGAVEGYGDYRGGRIVLVLSVLMTVLENLYQPVLMIGILLALYLIYRIFLSDKNEPLPSVLLLGILFACGLGYVVVLPHGARMPYQGRQMAPFFSLLAGGVAWSVVLAFRKSLSRESTDMPDMRARIRTVLMPMYLLIAAVALIIFGYQFSLNDRFPVYYIPTETPEQLLSREGDFMRRNRLMAGFMLRDDVEFMKQVRNLPTTHEQVFFDLGGLRSFWDPNYVPGYPQINPIVEFYAGSRPILCFNMASGVVEDIAYMIRYSRNPFSPVLISYDYKMIEEVLSGLDEKGLLTGRPSDYFQAMGRFAVDLTPFMKWRQ